MAQAGKFSGLQCRRLGFDPWCIHEYFDFFQRTKLRRVHTGHPMRIEPDRIQFEHVHIECAFAQSRLIPIHFQRWF